MKKLLQNKKAIVMIIIAITIYTIHSFYINKKLNISQAKNDMLQIQLEEARKPSELELKKEKIISLYDDRLYIKSNIESNYIQIEKLKQEIQEDHKLVYQIESHIRCEKINLTDDINANCIEEWEDYPKK